MQHMFRRHTNNYSSSCKNWQKMCDTEHLWPPSVRKDSLLVSLLQHASSHPGNHEGVRSRLGMYVLHRRNRFSSGGSLEPVMYDSSSFLWESSCIFSISIPLIILLPSSKKWSDVALIRRTRPTMMMLCSPETTALTRGHPPVPCLLTASTRPERSRVLVLVPSSSLWDAGGLDDGVSAASGPAGGSSLISCLCKTKYWTVLFVV